MKKQQGFALIYSLIVMVVVGALVTGAVFQSIVSTSVASNDRNAANAQYMAEAGLTRFKTMAFQSYRFMNANLADYGFTAADIQQLDCSGGNLLALGIDTDRVKNGTDANGNVNTLYTIDMVSNTDYPFEITLPNGTVGGYVITLANSGDQLISRGYVGGGSLANGRARATSALSLAVAGGNPYNNAIFVDGGFFGPSINGKVSVFGSIHSIRGDVVVGDPGLALTGTAGVYNDYSGEGPNSDERTRIAALGGDNTIGDLCARIKLKSGNLDIGSNSVSVGQPTSKAKGIYLNPNATITGSTANIFVETPSLVSLYNSDLDVPMPTLEATYPLDAGSAPLTTQSCPRLARTITIDKVGYPGLGLPPTDQSTGFTCGDANGSISWVAPSGNAPGYAQISGIVNTGALPFGVLGDVQYQGKGTIRAGASKTDTTLTAKIIVDGSLVPRGGDFPATNALGLVSSGTMTVGDSAQTMLAAALFAQGAVTVSKQTLILGSVIANAINIGEQVPSIAYDPRLPKNMPPGMPGAPGPGGTSRPVVRAYERR